MDKSTADLLIDARDLISDPDDWCQGMMVEPKPEGELRHCALGAVETVCFSKASNLYADRVIRVTRMLKKAISVVRPNITGFPFSGPGNFHNEITNFNDRVIHEEVMNLFDEAIRIAKDEN